MMSWLDDAKAGYVLAAYGITVVALGVLLAVTWRDWRRAQAAWRRIAATRTRGVETDEPSPPS